MYNQWDNLHNPDQTASLNRHNPDISMLELKDVQNISYSRLDNYLDQLTPVQESPHDDVTIGKLTVWPD